MKFFGCTDVGKRRQNNQDRFIINEYENGWTLCAVFDGMGGANGGSEASAIASWVFGNGIGNRMDKLIQSGEHITRATADKMLRDAAYEANRVVYEKSREDESLSGMGTTAVAALVSPDEIFILNIGDSRLYTERFGGFVQVTKDHSYVQYLVDEGTITKEEADKHPKKNLITRCIGTDETVEPDTFRLGQLPSYMLLCSDGLTNFVSEKQISDILTNGDTDGEEKIHSLINTANAGGGGDNITVVLMTE